MRLYCCLAVAVVTVWSARPICGQEKPQRKLYSDENLAEARKALKEYRFKDQNLGKVFSPDNKEYVGVLLEIKREGNVVKEIVVYGRTAKNKRLALLATLNRKDNSDDLKALIDKLKI